MTFYIPHESLIFTNDLEEFRADKTLRVYDYKKKSNSNLPYELEIHLSGNYPSRCKDCSYAACHTGKILE